MYENEITAAVNDLNRTRKYNSITRVFDWVTPVKLDKQYLGKVGDVLSKLTELGFGQWSTGTVPNNNSSWDPRAAMIGATTGGAPVTLQLWQHAGKRTPKNITMAVTDNDQAKCLVLGTHSGVLRMTDLRDYRTYYDDVVWEQRHFAAQLAADLYNKRISASPDAVQRQLSAAIVEAARVGITGGHHVLLPRPNNYDYGSIVMVPYLVGVYGVVPTAVRIDYLGELILQVEFRTIDKAGFCSLCFGTITIDEFGKVASRDMDVAALLQATI